MRSSAAKKNSTDFGFSICDGCSSLVSKFVFLSIKTRPSTVATSVTVESTNGKRGSTPLSAMPRYGAIAEAIALPASTRVDSQGMLGVAAWRASKAHGGERNAEDV